MDAAGFLRVTAFNPYWEVNGVTFVDRDGYRTVLQNRAWGKCETFHITRSLNNLPEVTRTAPGGALSLFRPQPRRHGKPGQQTFRTEQTGDGLPHGSSRAATRRWYPCCCSCAVAAARSRTSNSIHACGTGSVSGHCS